MNEKLRFLGLDVHAETIAVAVAEPNGEVRSLGMIANREDSIRKFIRKLGSPEHLRACYEAVPEPAWKAKPSWYLLTTEDRMIPPDAQRQMSKRAGAKVVEVRGSHAIYVSQPQAVAHIIEAAAKGVLVAETERGTTSAAAD